MTSTPATSSSSPPPPPPSGLAPALTSYNFTDGQQTNPHLAHTIREDDSTVDRRVLPKNLPDGSPDIIPSVVPSSSPSPASPSPPAPSTAGQEAEPSISSGGQKGRTGPSPMNHLRPAEGTLTVSDPPSVAPSGSTSSPRKQQERSSNVPAGDSTVTARSVDQKYDTSARGTTVKKKKKKPFSFASFLPCLSPKDRDYDDGGRQELPSSNSSHPSKPSQSVPPMATAMTSSSSSSPASAPPISPPSTELVAPVAASAALDPPVGRESVQGELGLPSSSSSSLPAGRTVPASSATEMTTRSPVRQTPTDSSQVIIPPSTPVTPPLDETEGVTSSSVVPPGFDPNAQHQHQHHHHHQQHPSTSSTTTTSSFSADSANQPTAYPHTHRISTRPSTPSPPAGVIASSSSVSASDSFAGTDSDDGRRYDSSDADRDADADAELEGEGGILLDDDESDDDVGLLGGIGIPLGPDGEPRPLLPPLGSHHSGRKCLVLDLDETLLHSSFKMIPHADYIVPVEIESQVHNVYVIKRPGVDNFLKKMGEVYEVVVFTASLSKYADPVLDILDIHRVVAHRLFRESCYNHKGNYVKDLSQLGRPIEETIIIDNSPASYLFHPNNAVPVSTWFNDPHDSELSDLVMFLEDLSGVPDVRGVLDGGI